MGWVAGAAGYDLWHGSGGAPPGDWPGDADGGFGIIGRDNEKGGIYGELFLKVQSGRVFGVI